jgi:RHS repeat-associated protein
VAFGYDGRGNLNSSGSTVYGYSSENLMTAGNNASLLYDPALRLVQTNSAVYGTTRYGYDGVDLIGEYDAANIVQRRYVHGPGSDEPIVWYEGAGLTDKRFLHADERGSITAISNASGTVTNINTYDDYGIPAATNVGRFGYTGQAWIGELGMYYYKARIYSPTLGRFMQSDPIGYGDGPNMYNYVGSDPVNGRYPTGLSVFCNAISYNSNTTVEGIPPARLTKSECSLIPYPGLWASVGGDLADRDRQNEWEQNLAALVADANAAVPGAGPQSQKKDDPGCKQAMQEPGNVEVGSLNFTAIVGGGVTGSWGTFRNVETGTTGNYYTLGGGAGVDVGPSMTAGTYRSAGDLSGGSANLSGTFGIFTGSASFGMKGLNYIGAVFGLAPPSKAVSGTLTGTRLYWCKVGG